jgi:hypothetical protein
MVAPGLLERIISPAILLPKTSLRLGDTDTEELSSLHSSLKAWHIKLYRSFKNALLEEFTV